MRCALIPALLLAACTPPPTQGGGGSGWAAIDSEQRSTRIAVEHVAEPALNSIPDRVLTNTEHVEGMAVTDDALWVATRGGVERYARDTGKRARLYTTLDGLAANHVWRIVADEGVTARTREHLCTLTNKRFHCVPAPALPTPEPAVAQLYRGLRVTARAGEFIGTAGAGVWMDGPGARRLTPTDQICSNHITAMAEFGGRRWFGSFDEGVCVSDDDRSFARVQTPFRMVNDLAATPKGLYVAAGAGLFRTKDGERFERVKFVSQRGVNGLAFDGRSLWATTPGALWRVRIKGGPRSGSWWRPGGSRSLQGVAVHKRSVWLVSEDRGAIRKNKRSFEVFDRAAGAPTSWALAIAVDARGTAWVGTLRHGLLSIDKRGRVRSVRNLPDSWLLDVRVAGGEVLVGTQSGAARVDGRGHVTTIADVPHPNVHAFHIGGGATWVGTEGGTLVTSGS